MFIGVFHSLGWAVRRGIPTQSIVRKVQMGNEVKEKGRKNDKKWKQRKDCEKR